MKDILFVVDEMRIGGVSKVLCDTLNALDYSKYHVDVLVLHKHGEMLDMLNSNVQVLEGTRFFNIIDIRIGEILSRKNLLMLIRKLKMFSLIKFNLISSRIKKERKKLKLKEYDIEIAYKDGFCTLFTAYGNAKKKINWVHSDYSLDQHSKRYEKQIMEALKHINVNVSVSKEAGNAFERKFGVAESIVINNIIDAKGIERNANKNIPELGLDFNIVSVGRLSPEKNYFFLIDVHLKLLEAGYKNKIYLIGDGPQYFSLKERIRECEIQDTFFLLGFMGNPYPYIAAADLYVSTSKYESFSLTIREALILKTPIISTKVAGVKNIEDIENYGVILNASVESFFNTISTMIADSEILKRYKKNLKLEYKYSNEDILNRINKILSS